MMNSDTTGSTSSSAVTSTVSAPSSSAVGVGPSVPLTTSCPLAAMAPPPASTVETGLGQLTADTSSLATNPTHPADRDPYRYVMPFARTPIVTATGLQSGGPSNPFPVARPNTVDEVEGILRSLLDQVASSRTRDLHEHLRLTSGDRPLRRNLFGEITQPAPVEITNAQHPLVGSQQPPNSQFSRLTISPLGTTSAQLPHAQPAPTGQFPPHTMHAFSTYPHSTNPPHQPYQLPPPYLSAQTIPPPWAPGGGIFGNQFQQSQLDPTTTSPFHLARDRELELMREQMQEMTSQLHQVIRAAPEVDRVLRETQNTPFTSAITNFPLRNPGKITIPTFDGTTDPSQYLTIFNIAMGRARLTPEERDAGKCQFFVESLRGDALRWFTRLEPNTISSFKQLTTAFVANYLMLVEKEASTTELWSMMQEPKEPLRKFIERFKQVASRISIPDGAGLVALNNALLFSPDYRRHLWVNKPQTLEDALHQAVVFIELEEDEERLAKRLQVLHPTAKNTHGKDKEHAVPEPRQHINRDFTGNRAQHPRPSTTVLAVSDRPQSNVPWNKYIRDKNKDAGAYCDYHKIGGHSNQDCRALQKYLLQKFQRGEIDDPNIGNPTEENAPLAVTTNEHQPEPRTNNAAQPKRPRAAREPADEPPPPKAMKLIN